MSQGFIDLPPTSNLAIIICIKDILNVLLCLRLLKYHTENQIQYPFASNYEIRKQVFSFSFQP